MTTRKAPRPNRRGKSTRTGAGGQITIEVTQEIIEQSMQRQSSHCMIAEAVRAVVGERSRPSVDLQTIRYTDQDRDVRYIVLTPPAAQMALIAFDQGLPVQPFTARLRPAQVIAVEHKPKKGERKAAPAATPAKPSVNTPTGRKRLVKPVGGTNIPVIVGGDAPPLAVLSNRRGAIRAYGLRQLRP